MLNIIKAPVIHDLKDFSKVLEIGSNANMNVIIIK